MSIRLSGSQLTAQPSPSGPRPITSLLPSRSTATISSAPQLENHSRPSCQRGDSGIARPLSSTRGCMTWEELRAIRPPFDERFFRRLDLRGWHKWSVRGPNNPTVAAAGGITPPEAIKGHQ